ncbi:tail fiber protein [Ralstonia phage PQ43W]
MQSSSRPLKWTVPFAQNDSSKVELPVSTSDPTRASLQKGFPPGTMQPPESGGVPPQGEDFNGGMNQIARIAWWLMMGGGFPFDSTFANDSNIGGYPLGATVPRSDGTGYWLNTAENNTTNPEATDGSAANWVAAYNYGWAAVSGLAGANVTLTPAQAAKQQITLTGTLTANIQLIFPTWQQRWEIVNNTTGAFTVTAKTAGGSGIVVNQNVSTPVIGDGTNILQPLEQFNVAPALTATNPVQMGQVQSQSGTAFTTAGTAPAFTLTPAPAVTAYGTSQRFSVTFNAAGTTGSNTLNVSGLGAKNLKQYNAAGAKVAAIIPAAGFVSDVVYDGTDMVVLDPVVPGTLLAVRYFTSTTTYTPTAGTNSIEVEGVGGGGAGGGCPVASAAGAAGSGGGAGCYGRKRITSNFAGVTITIGAAGIGVAGGAGGAGGATSFGALLSLPGGLGGGAGVASTAAGWNSTPGGSGGAASGADLGVQSASGLVGLVFSASNVTAGAGASSAMGAGGGPVNAGGTSVNTGQNAQGFGGGGGGAAAANSGIAAAGGNGSPGVMVVREYA